MTSRQRSAAEGEFADAAADVHDRGAPGVGWASGPLGVVQAADREIAVQTARRARAVAEFAASRPASADREPGRPGAMSAARRAARPAVLAEVSEWAASELSVALSISKEGARQLLVRSLTLVHMLPATLAALESGLLHTGHLFAMLERVAVITDQAKRADMEREVLAWVAGRAGKRQITTPAQLGARLRRIGLGRDPKQEAEELLAALKQRGVWVRSDRRAGMAVLESLLTVPEAQAVVDALGRYVDAQDDPTDTRTRGQQMADVLLDLVLRPGETALAPVQAQLTLVAGVRAVLGGSAAGEIGGEPVPAEMIRAVARALGLLPEPAVEDAAQDEATAHPVAVPDREDPAVALIEEGPDESWSARLRAAWHRAEDEDVARALAGVWRGCLDEPSPEEQLRIWAEQQDPDQEFQQDPDQEFAEIVGRLPDDEDPDTEHDVTGAHAGQAPGLAQAPGAGPPADSGTGPGGTGEPSRACRAPGRERWPAAHAALHDANVALLALHQAVRRAAAAVGDARWADEQHERFARAHGGGRFDAATSDLEALRSATAQQRGELAALLERSGGGTLVDRPRIALVDELTGVLLALTDARELRRLAHCGRPACRRRPQACQHDLSGYPGLGPPSPNAGHDPTADLDRYVRARDRVCRFPGCRRTVRELDHNVPWPDGPTSAENLEGFCTGDHRGKHQAPGWSYDLDPDGALTVTTPSGLTATTDPPPF